MVVKVLFQGAYTTFEDKDDIEHYTKLNKCGVCRLGLCMCPDPKVYGPPRPTRDQRTVLSHKSEPGLGYRGMAYDNPIAQRMIEQDTAAFRAEMQAEIQAGIARRKRSEC